MSNDLKNMQHFLHSDALKSFKESQTAIQEMIKTNYLSQAKPFESIAELQIATQEMIKTNYLIQANPFESITKLQTATQEMIKTNYLTQVDPFESITKLQTATQEMIKINYLTQANPFEAIAEKQVIIQQLFSKNNAFAELNNQLQSTFSSIQKFDNLLEKNNFSAAIDQAQQAIQNLQKIDGFSIRSRPSNKSVYEINEEEQDKLDKNNFELDYNLVFEEALQDSSNEQHIFLEKILEFTYSVEEIFGLKKGEIADGLVSYSIGKIIEFLGILLCFLGSALFLSVFNITNTSEFDNLPKYEENFLKQRVKEIEQKHKENTNVSFRLVIKDIPIYSSNRRDSTKIGNLFIGDEVQIIQKKKNWSKIKWIDEDTSQLISGWVFTRYLKVIK